MLNGKLSGKYANNRYSENGSLQWIQNKREEILGVTVSKNTQVSWSFQNDFKSLEVEQKDSLSTFY